MVRMGDAAGADNRSFIHRDAGRGEIITGLVWLCVGALISVLLQVIYLGTWVTLPGGTAVAFPYPIVLALLFNLVLTRTSLLWTDNRAVAALPLWTWVAGFAVLTIWTGVSGDQIVASSIRSVLLLCAGVAGGIWPLISRA